MSPGLTIRVRANLSTFQVSSSLKRTGIIARTSSALSALLLNDREALILRRPNGITSAHRLQLLKQRLRHFLRGRCHDNLVEGRVLSPPARTIANSDADVFGP